MTIFASLRRLPIVLACTLTAAIWSPAARAQTAPPADTGGACPQVEAALDATIDTKKVQAGDLFHFTTLGPVSVGETTIGAGARGTGIVETLDHSKSQGHSGYLVLEARYLEAADGSHVPVMFVPGGDGRSQAFERASSASAGLIGYLPYYIGTAAGVYNTFHHGKDAAVVRGKHFPLVAGDAFLAGRCRLDIDQR